MPGKKNPLLRYQFLDRCFRKTMNRLTFQKLVDLIYDKLGDDVSDRTLRADIRFMREHYNAPIVARINTTESNDSKECVYYYSDPYFSIFKTELDEEDLKSLQQTLSMLGKYRGGPANAWLEEVVSSLEYRFGIKANREKLIAFEENTQLKGLKHLSTLIDATINHQPLQVLYRSYKGKEMDVTFHPYYMKQYNGRWFLFGMDHENKRILNLALDRMVTIKKSKVKFLKNSKIDFNTYFNNIIGVTMPDGDVKAETIILKFEPKRFPYVVTKPIHLSQQIVNDEECIVSICVKPNKELFQRIFSFIPDVTVLEPEWLRSDVEQKLKENLQKYL